MSTLQVVEVDPNPIPKALRRTYRIGAAGWEHKCTKCNTWMPADREHFRGSALVRTGLSTTCHPCNRRIVADWVDRNPARMAAKTRRYQTRVAAAEGKLTAEEREALFNKYNRRCLCCRRHESVCGGLELDHIIPVCFPGTSNSVENRQVLCSQCNAKKGQRVIDYRPRQAYAAAQVLEVAA